MRAPRPSLCASRTSEDTRVLDLREELRSKFFGVYCTLRDFAVNALIGLIAGNDTRATRGKYGELSGGYVLNHLGCMLAEIPRHWNTSDRTLTFAGFMSGLREVQDSAFTHGDNIDRVQLLYLIRRIVHTEFLREYGEYLGVFVKESPEGHLEIIDNEKWQALHTAPVGEATGRWGEIYMAASALSVPQDIANEFVQVKFAGNKTPIIGIGMYIADEWDKWDKGVNVGSFNYYHVYNTGIYKNKMFANSIWQYPRISGLARDCKDRRDDFYEFVQI